MKEMKVVVRWDGDEDYDEFWMNPENLLLVLRNIVQTQNLSVNILKEKLKDLLQNKEILIDTFRGKVSIELIIDAKTNIELVREEILNIGLELKRIQNE